MHLKIWTRMWRLFINFTFNIINHRHFSRLIPPFVPPHSYQMSWKFFLYARSIIHWTLFPHNMFPDTILTITAIRKKLLWFPENRKQWYNYSEDFIWKNYEIFSFLLKKSLKTFLSSKSLDKRYGKCSKLTRNKCRFCA